jgi:hypothetical protein
MVQNQTQKWTAANEVTLVSVHLKEKQKANWGDNNPTLLWNWPWLVVKKSQGVDQKA